MEEYGDRPHSKLSRQKIEECSLLYRKSVDTPHIVALQQSYHYMWCNLKSLPCLTGLSNN